MDIELNYWIRDFLWDVITHPRQHFNGGLGMEELLHPTVLGGCIYLSMS